MDADVPIDVYAIGFEEIVDLNASNIMSARWETSYYNLSFLSICLVVCLFVRDLLRSFSTDLAEIACGGHLGVRERPRENGIKKLQSVAMEIRKFSPS